MPEAQNGESLRDGQDETIVHKNANRILYISYKVGHANNFVPSSGIYSKIQNFSLLTFSLCGHVAVALAGSSHAERAF